MKNAFQPVMKNALSGFVAELNPSGSALVYSTFLSGSTIYPAFGLEGAFAIAVDASGSAYVTGHTGSADFPVVNAFQPFLWPLCDGDARDSVYVTKFAPLGGSLAYSTLIGGGCIDENGTGIAVDAQGSAYIIGNTIGLYFPSTSALPLDPPTPLGGMFVAKLSPSGGALVYDTLFGGAWL